MELGRPLGAVRAASGRYQQSEREGGRNDQPDEDEKGDDKALGHGNPLPLSSIGRLERAEGSCAVTKNDRRQPFLPGGLPKGLPAEPCCCESL